MRMAVSRYRFAQAASRQRTDGRSNAAPERSRGGCYSVCNSRAAVFRCSSVAGSCSLATVTAGVATGAINAPLDVSRDLDDGLAVDWRVPARKLLKSCAASCHRLSGVRLGGAQAASPTSWGRLVENSYMLGGARRSLNVLDGTVDRWARSRSREGAMLESWS